MFLVLNCCIVYSLDYSVRVQQSVRRGDVRCVWGGVVVDDSVCPGMLESFDSHITAKSVPVFSDRVTPHGRPEGTRYLHVRCTLWHIKALILFILLLCCENICKYKECRPVFSR